jgi:hypothetical protein
VEIATSRGFRRVFSLCSRATSSRRRPSGDWRAEICVIFQIDIVPVDNLLAIVDAFIAEMTIVPVAALAPVLAGSEIALRDAVPSRNGSIKDAHVPALAWSVEADIWTTDCDFAGTGVATWSTPNLMRGLAEAAKDRV